MSDTLGLGPVYPAFQYEDAPAAVNFLERAFGLTRGLVVPGPEGRIEHAELSTGSGGVMLGSKSAPSPDDPWRGKSFGVYVVVEDIEGHYERAKAAGARIVRELQDTPYGSREYSALDHEGNPWSFGTYRPGETTG